MRPRHTCARIPSDTQIYINDYLNHALSETPTRISPHRTTRFPTALLVLTLGLGLAMLVMLGTWLSLPTPATDRVTTFVAHPEEQTLSADELEDMGLPPAYLDDFLTHF